MDTEQEHSVEVESKKPTRKFPVLPLPIIYPPYINDEWDELEGK